ncbi:PTS sugar transporter subunit IIA [Shouchella lehensis]|uniref:Glucose-specific phosphotransferase enzyme IIA component n=2 Tax=Shouchella lehensis TaxID=300825 RepID=A0A060LWK8_9BACI|nr:PTS glucose transporter subunit IIA [Shouchella lehensis]AIC94165.1 Glucose-specific phosphotransferase enzyme IIA component [Shouchella lehensis G1]MBG9785787.1 PTS glucose transporter subunit IIA [Shouchella lehensis]RQW20078.1 PTS glucose transporter subunit IIA [Bacillus sp. C1-1]TES48256.1 PTS glucose transporter subunit IIA [Shouchella lehensis]
MLKKLFGKKQVEPETLVAPMNGTAVAIEEVPDPTFGEKMIGDGLAIQPTEGKVVAPIGGKVVQVFPTKHAFGIETENGAELLVHIGLETVAMNGEGFTAHVQEGDKVKAGDMLIEFDLELVKEKASNTITPIVVTNHDQFTIEKIAEGTVVANESPFLKLTKK